MTWLHDLIEKAKKAMQDSPNQDLDLVEFECEATPQRIIALGEVVEAAREVKVAQEECDKEGMVTERAKSSAPLVRLIKAHQHLKDALARLDELEEK